MTPRGKVEITTDAGHVVTALATESVAVQGRIHKVVVGYGARLQAGVKRRAALPRTGPPGPRLITGNYNRSINRRNERTAQASAAYIGTNAPQGRRLELGFHGTDSAGRVYNQPAYPHFGPALDEIDGPFRDAVAQAGHPGAGR